jgi:hypothetical protein
LQKFCKEDRLWDVHSSITGLQNSSCVHL